MLQYTVCRIPRILLSFTTFSSYITNANPLLVIFLLIIVLLYCYCLLIIVSYLYVVIFLLKKTNSTYFFYLYKNVNAVYLGRNISFYP